MKKTISIVGTSKKQRKEELERIKKKYEKKGYIFLEYIDDGMTKSNAIFEVSETIVKNELKTKVKIWIPIIIIITFFIYFNDTSKIKITPTSLEKDWPFTTQEAVLKCYKDDDIKSPVIEINGIPYGLTGFADNKYGQSDINALNKYWRKNPKIKGTRINLTEVTNKALSLCN